MNSLKNACDKCNMHKAIKIIDATVHELCVLPLVGISQSTKVKVLNHLAVLMINVSRFMFENAVHVIKKIMVELHMVELMMKRRLLSHSQYAGVFSKLPNDVMVTVGAMII
jgi:uncharacterized membrane protein YozB (DUF420 family)